MNMTLLPGDVILTGTPAGVGPIKSDDRLEVRITGLAPLINTVKVNEGLADMKKTICIAFTVSVFLASAFWLLSSQTPGQNHQRTGSWRRAVRQSAGQYSYGCELTRVNW